jgi:predicted transposase YdaD
MTNPTILEHNIETDEVIEREMTNDEFAAFKENQDQTEAEQAIAEAKESAKADLLTKLGITADEAALLLS